jgi:hypothetical protein
MKRKKMKIRKMNKTMNKKMREQIYDYVIKLSVIN